MNDTVSVFGVELKDIPAENAKEILSEYLNNHVLNAMEIITKEMLIHAGENEDYKSILESLDVHIVLDRDIYKAAGYNEEAYEQKAVEQIVWKTLLELVLRQNKNCFLIGETEEETSILEQYLRESAPGIRIIGSEHTDGLETENVCEQLINECNASATDVVFSALPVPFQEQFLVFARDKMGARMWIGLGKPGENGLTEEEGFLFEWIGNAVFRSMASKYRRNRNENA